MKARTIVKTIGGVKKNLPGSSFAFKMSFTGRIDTDVARQMVILVVKSDRNDKRVKIRFTDLSRGVSGVMHLPASIRESTDWAPAIMGAYGGGHYEPCAPILNAQHIYNQFIESNEP